MCKNYQLALPKVIRNKLTDVTNKDTIIDWYINENNGIVIKPRKKVSLDVVLGIIEEDDSRDAFELKGVYTNENFIGLIIYHCNI